MTTMPDYNNLNGTEAELPPVGKGPGEERARRLLERRAGKVSADDLRDLSGRLRTKVSDLKELEKGLYWIGTLIGRAKLLFSMMRDPEFRIDLSTKLLIAGGLIYFILPTDLTPDFIPGIGYVDDAVVLGTLWKLVSDELERYILLLRETGRIDDDLESLAFGREPAPSPESDVPRRQQGPLSE